MTQARKNLISIADTPYYHCISRCVRRAYLCGADTETGQSYEHRKEWILERLELIAQVYTIDVCAYAIMDNHYHFVLKVDEEQADLLSEDEVIESWMSLFKGNVLVNRFLKGQCKSQGEKERGKEIVELWRERLSDISWFMRSINEFISRKANQEDGCKGHFWEGRFKSQALLNEKALLSCMVYVDLNPIRARICESLDESDFTSIQQRIIEYSKQYTRKQVKRSIQTPEDDKETNIKLVEFINDSKPNQSIPFSLKDYFELADWTGRIIRDDKKGYIPDKHPKILLKLGLEASVWLDILKEYNSGFHAFIGSEIQMKQICQSMDIKWLSGIKSCRRLLS